MISGAGIEAAVTAEKPQPDNVVDLLIQDQLRNERLGAPTSERLSLVEALVRQAPHRIYFNEAGEACRVLLYSGRYAHEAYIDVMSSETDGFRKIKGEFFSGLKSQDIEKEIALLRSQYGMKFDLIADPSLVYAVPSKNQAAPTFIHVGQVAETPVAACQYHITPWPPVTPRYISFGPGVLQRVEPSLLLPISAPVPQILDYSRRFAA